MTDDSLDAIFDKYTEELIADFRFNCNQLTQHVETMIDECEAKILLALKPLLDDIEEERKYHIFLTTHCTNLKE